MMKHGLRLAIGAVLLFLTGCALLYPPYFYDKIVLGGNSNPENWSAIYVSKTLGDDTNSGTNASEPLRNIQTAIDRSKDYQFAGVRILIHNDTSMELYTSTNGLNANVATNQLKIFRNNVYIEGGYKSDFSSHTTGLRPLLSSESNDAIVCISNASHVTLANIAVSHSNMGGNFGTALIAYNSPNTTLFDMQFSDNFMGNSAVHIENSPGSRISVSYFIGNTITPLTLLGGGVTVEYVSFQNNNPFSATTGIELLGSTSDTLIDTCIFMGCSNTPGYNQNAGVISVQGGVNNIIRYCNFSQTGTNNCPAITLFPSAGTFIQDNTFDIGTISALVLLTNSTDSFTNLFIYNIVRLNTSPVSGFSYGAKDNRFINSVTPPSASCRETVIPMAHPVHNLSPSEPFRKPSVC